MEYAAIIPVNDNKSDYPNYDTYFSIRNADKKQTYLRVLYTAGWLIFISLFLIILSAVPESLTSFILYIVSTFIRVLGICIYSTIPSEELDLIEILLTNKIFKLAVSIGLASLGTLQCIAIVIQEIVSVYIISFLFLAVGCFSLVMIHPNVSYFTIVFVIYLIFLVASIGLLSLQLYYFMYLSYDYVWFVCNLTCSLLFAACTVMIIFYFYVYYWEYKNKDWANLQLGLSDKQKHERAASTSKLLNESLYTLFFIVGIVYIIDGIGYQFGMNVAYLGGSTESYRANEKYYLSGFFDLLPFMIVATFGSRKCFTIVSRLFELQLERLQDDGATLAELISKTNTVHQSSKDIWVYRYRESTKHGKVDGYIDRRFWFRASIIKSDAELMVDTVEVNLSSDSDSIGSDKHLDWQAKFCESELKYHKYPFTKNGEGNYVSTSDTGGANDLHCEVCLDTCTLDEWIASNLDTSQVKVVSCEDLEKVQFQISRKKNETKSKEAFRKWIYSRTPNGHGGWTEDSNLRKFDWINFENDLLKRSPRELATDFDKTYTYGLSSKLNLRSITDIDYFISHSWNDNAGHKIRALRKFFRSFQFLYNRDPVVWLDKVCIDQRKPDDAIAALPLIICSCNKVLVMMSDSYMKRLWCVWELFTLFSFCNKEVAMDRLELVALGDKTEEENIIDAMKNLKNFNIDSAQCFDPNEEQKLRIIMKQIGTDRLKNGLDDIAKMLKDKLDHNIKKQLEID